MCCRDRLGVYHILLTCSFGNWRIRTIGDPQYHIEVLPEAERRIVACVCNILRKCRFQLEPVIAPVSVTFDAAQRYLQYDIDLSSTMDHIAAAHHCACLWLATQPLEGDLGLPPQQRKFMAPTHEPYVYRPARAGSNVQMCHAATYDLQGIYQSAAQWGVIHQGVLADVRGASPVQD